MMKRLVLLLLVLLGLWVCITAAVGETEQLLTCDPSDNGYVPGVALYVGPSDASPAKAWLFGNVPAEVLDKGSGYVQLSVCGLTGWVHEANTVPEGEGTPAPGRQGKVYGWGCVRYRSLYDGPDGRVIASLSRDVSLRVLAILSDNEWMLVQLEDDTLGYIPVSWVVPRQSETLLVQNDVPGDRLHLREQPTTKSESLGKYYSGVQVVPMYTVQTDDEWLRVNVYDRAGWMRREYLTPVQDGSPRIWLPPTAAVITQTDDLNLRQGPGYDHPVLTSYPAGTTTEILATTGNWSHVRLSDGQAGFMLTKNLGGEPEAAVPAEVPVKLGGAVRSTEGTVIGALFPGDTCVLCESRPWQSWTWSDDERAMVFAAPQALRIMKDDIPACISADLLGLWDSASAPDDEWTQTEIAPEPVPGE